MRDVAREERHPLSHASGYATAVACEKQFINNNLVSGL